MEENYVRDADSAADSAGNVTCQDEGNNPSQKEILQETKFLISGQLTSMDTANSPLKEASSNEPPFKLLLGKSPKFRTPVKNRKLNPFKSTKKLFISPSKRKESKATLKRHKSSELSPEEDIVKRYCIIFFAAMTLCLLKSIIFIENISAIFGQVILCCILILKGIGGQY